VCLRCHIEIDSRDVGEIATILVALEQEMPAIVQTWDGTAWIAVQNKIEILIGFGKRAIRQDAELRNRSRRVFERELPVYQLVQLKPGSDGRTGMAYARL